MALPNAIALLLFDCDYIETSRALAYLIGRSGHSFNPTFRKPVYLIVPSTD